MDCFNLRNFYKVTIDLKLLVVFFLELSALSREDLMFENYFVPCSLINFAQKDIVAAKPAHLPCLAFLYRGLRKFVSILFVKQCEIFLLYE